MKTFNYEEWKKEFLNHMNKLDNSFIEFVNFMLELKDYPDDFEFADDILKFVEMEVDKFTEKFIKIFGDKK